MSKYIDGKNILTADLDRLTRKEYAIRIEEIDKILEAFSEICKLYDSNEDLSIIFYKVASLVHPFREYEQSKRMKK